MTRTPLSRKRKPAGNPLKEIAKFFKSLIEPTPHSADDEEAQEDLRAMGLATVQVKALKFSAKSRAALSILALRDQVNALAPSRSKQSDGIIGDDNHKNRASDHNPWVMDGDVGVVTAIDITHDPDRGCDAWALAQSIVASRDSRIKYVIHNRQIATPTAKNGHKPWAWRPYGGTHPHTGHVHLSVQPDKARYDDTSAWDLSGMIGGSASKPSAKARLAAAVSVPGHLPAFAPTDPIAWGRRVGAAFKNGVIDMAARLRVDPNYLMAVMAFETGRTFDPKIRNAAGSGAIGLIQFMPKTAVGLGTSTAELERMTAVQQLVYVEKHLRPFTGKMVDLPSAYMAVLLPAAVSKAVSHVLFEGGTTAYRLNKGLDIDDDGKITKAEAAAKVQAALVEGMRPENFG